MAGAMLRGWIARGVNPACFHVVKPTATGLPAGVHHYTSAAEVGAKFDVLMLGIKPQKLAALATQAASLLAPKGQMISLLAGTEAESLQTYFPGAQIIRLMPNLAVEVGKSPLGLWAEGITDDQREMLDSWLAMLGSPIWLKQENQMDGFTALAGSGPAFVFRFIDALANAGTALGLDPAQSAQLALAMTQGAAQLAAQSPETPAQLAARVASPGGMTQAGLERLDHNNSLTELIEITLRSTADRGKQLAQIVKGEQA